MADVNAFHPLRTVALAATGAALLPAAPAAAAGLAGDLDTTFGTGGVALVQGLDDQNSVDVAILPDGRIQTGGRVRALRFLADGRPDPSFGANGVTFIPDDSSTDLKNASGVAVDAQGRTVIAGSSQPTGQGSRMALLRLRPDGTPDTSFGGGDGIAEVDVNPAQFAAETGQDVLVKPDGSYVVVGTTGSDAQERATVVQIRPDGTPDPAFAGSGAYVFGPIGSFGTEAERAELVGNDILVSGYAKPAVQSDPTFGFVARVRANGTPDTGFGGGDAVAESATRAGLTMTDVVVLPDGRIRQLGSTAVEGDVLGGRGVLTGYTASGAVDTAVGPVGQRTFDLTNGAGTLVAAMARAGDRLYVAGTTNVRIVGTAPQGQAVVGRLTLDGVPDPAYSGDGFAPLDDGSSFGVPTALAIDAAGRPVTAGWLITDAVNDRQSTRVTRSLAADAPALAPVPLPPAPPIVPGTPVKPPAAKKPTAASVLRLPSSSRCVSNRRVRLTVKAPSGLTIRKLTAKLGSARARTIKAPATLALKGRPRGKVKVVVTATLSDRSTLKRTVTYTLCAAKKRKKR